MQLLGQRSSSGELPTADFSASAASRHILLLSDATDVPEVLELLEQDGEELCRVRTSLLVRSWTDARWQLRPWRLEM